MVHENTEVKIVRRIFIEVAEGCFETHMNHDQPNNLDMIPSVSIGAPGQGGHL